MCCLVSKCYNQLDSHIKILKAKLWQLNANLKHVIVQFFFRFYHKSEREKVEVTMHSLEPARDLTVSFCVTPGVACRMLMNMFSSHESQNYDKTWRQVTFEVRDSALLRTRPRSEACARFTAKLAPLFKGPYRAEQVMSDLNPKLSRVSDDSD